MTPDRLNQGTRGGSHWLEKEDRPSRYAEPVLIAALFAIILSGFFFFARSDKNWEMIVTKHYWSPTAWYYGGYGWNIIETPKGYRAPQKEGLANYENIFPLEETASAKQAKTQVQGFPGPERLGVSFLLYALLHVPGSSGVSIWSDFWLADVLLWLSTIFLAHRVAAQFYRDRYTPWIAAILVAMYPTLLLTFNSIKLQPSGTTYLLLGIYLFERHLSKGALPLKIAGLTALFFFGLFANGAWFYLASFLFFQTCWQRGRDGWANLGSLILAVGISQVWLKLLTKAYHLSLVQEQWSFSLRRMFGDSYLWLRAWRAHQDLSQLRFANYYGMDLFTKILPLIGHAFFVIHAPLLLLALLAAWVEARARMFVIFIIPMLFAGHMGLMMVAWEFHYGYLSFPAGMMAIFAAAGALSWLITRRRLFPKILVVVVCLYIGVGFLDIKKQVNMYYGGFPDRFQRRVDVFYGDEVGHDSY